MHTASRAFRFTQPAFLPDRWKAFQYCFTRVWGSASFSLSRDVCFPQHVLLSSTYLECVKCVCGALTAEHPPGRCAAGQWTDGAHHARNVRHRPESNLDSDIRRGNRRVGREEGRSGGGGGGGCDAEVCAGGVGGDGGVG